MTFIGLFIHYFIRINISLAIVCMVATNNENTTMSALNSSTAVDFAEACASDGEEGVVGEEIKQVFIVSKNH